MRKNEPYTTDAQTGAVVYTPPEEREAVLIYRSVLKTARDADTPEEGNQILRDVLECAFGLRAVEDVPNPNRMIVRSLLVNIDNAARRYDEAVSHGRNGGRPRLTLDREKLKQDYAELGSWEKVAEKNNISRRALYTERMRWESEQMGKNLTKTNTKTKTDTNTFTKPNTYARPDGTLVTERTPAEKLEQAYRALEAFRAEQAKKAKG